MAGLARSLGSVTRRSFFLLFPAALVGCGQFGKPREKKTCYVCGGLGSTFNRTGLVEIRTTCSNCNGTGQVYK